MSESIDRIDELLADGYELQGVVENVKGRELSGRALVIGLAILRRSSDLLDEVSVDLFDVDAIAYAWKVKK